MLDLIHHLLGFGMPETQEPSLWVLGLAALCAAALMNRRQHRR